MKKAILAIIIASCLLIGCNTNDSQKACIDNNFDSNCCPQIDTTAKLLPTPKISTVNIFLETSGSMEGYMPNDMPSTNFQNLIPEAISNLNAEYPSEVKFFSIYDSKHNFENVNLDNARNKILHGTFEWSGSTYLPIMLDSVMKTYLQNQSVTIFISDCIYSPEKKDEKQANLALTDIRDEVRPYAKDFSTTVFCLNSEFRTKKITTKTSPYYMILQGKPENLKVIEKLLIKSFVTVHQSFQEIHFGQQYSSPYFTALPYTETSGNFIAFPCASFNGAFLSLQDIDLSASTNEIEVWLGIDLKEFPDYVTAQNFLDSNLVLTANKGTAKIISVVTKDELISKVNSDDKELADKCTNFIQMKITELNENVSSLYLSLKYSRPNWIASFNEPDLKNQDNREKTYGLDNIISGLEQAYSVDNSTCIFKNLTISLIKK